MIKTNNPELDVIIESLQSQRNEALDALAIIGCKLKTQELLTVELQKKLDEQLKEKKDEMR